MLPHLYGELARHQDGLDLLEEENLIENAVDTIVQACTDTFEDIFQLKAALWAMVRIAPFVQNFNCLTKLLLFCYFAFSQIRNMDFGRKVGSNFTGSGFFTSSPHLAVYDRKVMVSNSCQVSVAKSL